MPSKRVKIICFLFFCISILPGKGNCQATKGQTFRTHTFNLTSGKTTGSIPDSVVRIAFINKEPFLKMDKESRSAFEFLKTIKGYNPGYLTFEEIRSKPKLLDSYKIIWFHRQDTSQFSASEREPKVVKAILSFLNKGGNLLLTLDAFHYINTLGIEPIVPTDSIKSSIDEGYGRKLGFHSFLDHPVFDGMFGGAYVMVPLKDTAFRVTGFFGDALPKNGKVLAVDWDYIFLRENSKLVLQYNVGPGRVLAVGGYTCFSPPNGNRSHLERFIRNIFMDFNSENVSGIVHYWNYKPQNVSPAGQYIHDFDRPFAAIPESEKWILPDDPLKLEVRFASHDYWDVAGERMLTMGSENAGIEEIWAHPFMAFRDYEVGIRFEYKDTIYWLKDERPEVEVLPWCFTRSYKFPRAYLHEILANDPKDPCGVIHYEYRGVYPAELVIKFKSNLRLMWPYSEKVLGSLGYAFDADYNAFFVQDEQGICSAMIGANRKPDTSFIGQYSDIFYDFKSKIAEVIPCTDTRVYGMLCYPLRMNDCLDVVYSATSEGRDSTRLYFDAAVRRPSEIATRAKDHVKHILENSLVISSPDKDFNLGYQWAILATDRFFVNTPGMGKSLVAGYSTTQRGWDGGHKINGRPGYGWYFGRDGEWSGFALLDYGDFDKVKSELEFYRKYQDLAGKIFHEATTSGVVHYDAADATPLYIILAGKYFRHTGDTAFLHGNWPAIKRAIDFCYSTDSDHDHLIENTNVGHGWVEGGELYGSHATIYMQGCWAAALEESANMASALRVPESGKYAEESRVVKNLINTKFWNPVKKYFCYGMNKDKTFRTEETVLPAVPLYFKSADPEKASPVLDQLASNAFSTNWGVRILRDDSPFFKPAGYHYGSVWPLFTGWTALAEYAYGNYNQGFSHIMNNLDICKNWGKGFVEEVMNGSEYEPSGVCPHQCWSETMVLQPAIEGMLGMVVNADENKVVLSPRFPADWDSASVTNIRVGRSTVDFKMKRTAESYDYTFTPHGDQMVSVEFSPAFPAGTKFTKVLLDGNENPFTSFNDQKGVSLLTSFKLTKPVSLRVDYELGIMVLPVKNDPVPGAHAGGVRVISSMLSGDKYYILVEGERKTSGNIDLYIHDQDIDKIENASFAGHNGEIFHLNLTFVPGESRYQKKTVIISLKTGSPPPVKSYLSGPFLSNLHATKEDALFTTYAAPLSRSSYKNDHGYSFLWNDEENGAEFVSKDGLNFGLAFIRKDQLQFRLKNLYREPVVTKSYSDLVTYYYYPSKDIRVEVLFDVYSSQSAIADIRIKNEGAFTADMIASPYLYYSSGDTLNSFAHESPFDFYSFPVKKNRDGWMKDHSIPLTEDLRGFMAGDIRFDSTTAFVTGRMDATGQKSGDPFRELKAQVSQNKRNARAVKGLIFSRGFRIEPGEHVHFRIALGLEDQKVRIPDLSRKIQPLFNVDLKELIKQDEEAYSKIPILPPRLQERGPGGEVDMRTFYYSCFSLLQQCMMPPEGLCKTNYYVFSREPEWGWGYGGQVFHESLSMLAYAYMDPAGAMNSQRVYFKRQHPDGYINYRTGPYLDETIPFKEKLTSSAPLFSYENLEIFRLTHDKNFLAEAYKSGAKLYRYFVANRDSNKNGLCEWGGEASLESLRDARVAVWDNVGWPSNFEGPDLNSMLVSEARSLEEMATLLGYPDEAAKWSKDANERSEMINLLMWDTETGFYYNINRENESFTYRHPNDLKIKEIIGFLPLWAGISDTGRTQRLVSSLINPEEFGRPFGVPALSAKDKYYNPIGYWNGPVWVQWDYLIFRGLLDHGYRKEAEELAMKVLDNMTWHLKQDHVFWEFYSPDYREAGWNRTYIWAGLAARFLIDLQK
jgi:glycogen debranching enzyme